MEAYATKYNDANIEQNQLHPLEVLIVHFSREDSVASKQYWPCDKFQERELNVMHFWYDEEFRNVRMSARSQDCTGEFQVIIDLQIYRSSNYLLVNSETNVKVPREITYDAY